ncbi:Trio And F-Actin-Binding Protein [Manis pentadactyla]|nr:Trio And F-Actin-Binding Protein [Manis pentadactyla]
MVCDATALGVAKAEEEEEVEVSPATKVRDQFLGVVEAFVPRNLLGVVVVDPGVPGRREGDWSSSAPIPREGPRASPCQSRELRGFPGETLHVQPAPLLLSVGSGARAGATADSRAGLSF